MCKLALAGLLGSMLLNRPRLHLTPIKLHIVSPSCVGVVVAKRRRAVFISLRRGLVSRRTGGGTLTTNTGKFGLIKYAYIKRSLRLHNTRCARMFSKRTNGGCADRTVLTAKTVSTILSRFGYALPNVRPVYSRLGVGRVYLSSMTGGTGTRLVPFRFRRHTRRDSLVVSGVIRTCGREQKYIPLGLVRRRKGSRALANMDRNSLGSFLNKG